jgi:hypothetical protein
MQSEHIQPDFDSKIHSDTISQLPANKSALAT